jgi:hypothetical protein
MRLGSLVAVLVLLCGTATACTTALYGAAAGGSPPAPATTATTATTSGPPQFGGAANLLTNGSFTGGTDPWVSNVRADLLVTSKIHRIGTTALLIRPSTPGGYFSPKAEIATTPSKGDRYSFDGWVHGSTDLIGAPVVIELGAVVMTGPTSGQLVTVAQNNLPLGRHWRHFSVHGVVPVAGATNITAIVAVRSVSKHSWLALDGVAAKLLPPVATSTRTETGSS